MPIFFFNEKNKHMTNEKIISVFLIPEQNVFTIRNLQV